MTFITPSTIRALPKLIVSSQERYRFLNRLALDRQCWPSVRKLSQLALCLKPFSRSAEDLFEGWVSQEIASDGPEGFYACNPSVVSHNGQLLCNLRYVDYEFGKIQDSSKSLNQIVTLDDDLNVISSLSVVHPPGIEGAKWQGLEDLRLFSYKQELWASYTVVDRHSSGICQFAVSRISDDGVVDEVRLQSFEGYRNQKNWMPFVDGSGFGWVYQCDPTLILKFDHRTQQALEYRRLGVELYFRHMRGGSQLVPWGDGWICLAHESHDGLGQRRYLHRFLEFGPSFAIRRFSDPFSFENSSVEFCAGLCFTKNGKQLLVSYGVEDRIAKIGRVDIQAVEGQLRPFPASFELPSPFFPGEMERL